MLTRRILLATPLLALPALSSTPTAAERPDDDDGLAALPHVWEPVDLSFVKRAPLKLEVRASAATGT